jgi:hypothetical protein
VRQRRRRGLPDLARVTELTTRINLFISLPIDKLERAALKKKLDEIGRK